MAKLIVQIPDEKADFIIELFKQLNFVQYEIDEPTKVEKNPPKKADEPAEAKEDSLNDRFSQLSELRNTINNLQQGRRQSAEPAPTALFRFPHGTELSAVKITSQHHLLTTIESYFRTNIQKLRFEALTTPDKYPMDKYIVYITLSDNSELKAGYCSAKLG
ncbi:MULTISPECIES: hypothetical protein [unclassified Carboxylicivirga]|uniref:hypothetical protein n=1 Tax=Carboxylicivirga TaxID=1628153 RepID=UPI003D358162